MTMGFSLVVRFELRDDEAAAAFDQLVAQTTPEIERREPDTLAYLVHSVPGEPLVRVFYELYRNRAAFDFHENQPHTKNFLTEREQHLSGVHVTFLQARTGKLA
ncbi:putative quinol monooxygenase [Actinoplanes sp. NPDC051859]|uniref:putative quinol monooxygenase n=1 Tax=Actinoplanes sp. NPDC051859 TaxID=3363909 RepID=UPI0037904CB5